jgi:hypothetical protein
VDAWSDETKKAFALAGLHGAQQGIYANSAAEAIYPPYRADSAGQPLDGSKSARACASGASTPTKTLP